MKEKTKMCGWCFQEIQKEKIDEHLERCHNDFQHKRK